MFADSVFDDVRAELGIASISQCHATQEEHESPEHRS